MAKKYRPSSINPLIILLLVAGGILITYFGINKFAASKKFSSESPVYPDNSALGVTYNFYQWYTSCTAEETDENPKADFSDCYRNTSYLTADLVKALDKKQKSVLCGNDLNFHSVGVKEINTTSGIEVSDTNSNVVVAKVTAMESGGSWKIADITCN